MNQQNSNIQVSTSRSNRSTEELREKFGMRQRKSQKFGLLPGSKSLLNPYKIAIGRIHMNTDATRNFCITPAMAARDLHQNCEKPGITKMRDVEMRHKIGNLGFSKINLNPTE